MDYVTTTAQQARPIIVHVSSSPSAAEWIGLGIGLFTAVATAIAAVAALRSARASETTSREARQALVAALEPALVLESEEYGTVEGDEMEFGPQRMWLRVTNVDRLVSATDLEATAYFADGTVATERREVLRPFAGGDDWNMPLRVVDENWPTAEPEVVRIRVEYSDANGAARYELTTTEQVHAQDGTMEWGEPGETVKRRLK